MSSLFTINSKDLVKGLIVTFFTTFTSSLIEVLDTLAFPTKDDWKHIALAGLAAGSAYLLKNFLTNSEGKILK